MTGDYKLKLFNYINNNYEEIQPADNRYQVEDMIELSFDEGGLDHPNLKYLLKDGNGVENGLILYINNIEDQDTGHLRSIYELRKIDGTYLANIQYTTSGEELPETEAAFVEDDGTLFIKTSATSTSFPNRIMMLNNICNKINDNYVFKIRKSYNIQDYYGETTFYCTNIYKSLTETKYILVGYEDRSSGTKRKLEILECTINVGSENEYKLIDNLDVLNGRIIIYDCFIQWNSDGEYKIRILLNTNETTKYLREYIKDYSTSYLTLNASVTLYQQYCKFCYTTHENAFFGIFVSEETSANKIYCAVYTIENHNIVVYTYISISTYPSSIMPDIEKFSKLNVIGDDVYLVLTDNTYTGLMVINIEKRGNYYYIIDKATKLFDLQNIKYGLSEVIVNKQYELTNIYSFNDTRTSTEMPQTNTYTCLNQCVLKSGPAQTLNSFAPNLAILRNNDKIVFARDLYNCIRQQNTITSTIDVPNVLLNDTTIISEELAAKANNIIDENDTTIEKNIYEELLVNFNDTYTIIDNNNNNNEINTNSSVMLAKEIIDIVNGVSTDYNKIMNKYRIVYGDDTTNIIDLPTPTLDTTNRIAEYDFVIGTQKFINRIEFISNDETMTYIIITLNVEANKIFRIKQKVKVI